MGKERWDELTISHELYNMGNMTRFLPSFPGYIYTCKDDTFYVNLFVAGRGEVVPSDLYRFLDDVASQPTLRVNAQAVPFQIEKGKVHVRRAGQTRNE